MSATMPPIMRKIQVYLTSARYSSYTIFYVKHRVGNDVLYKIIVDHDELGKSACNRRLNTPHRLQNKEEALFKPFPIGPKPTI